MCEVFTNAATLFFLDTPEMVFAAENKLFTECNGGGIDAVAQLIGSEDFASSSCLQHSGGAITIGEVETACGKYRGSVELASASEAMILQHGFTSTGIKDSQYVAVACGEVEQIVHDNS